MPTGRRSFLLGRNAAREPLLPPWAYPLPRFADACNRCGDCVTACQTEIIEIKGLFAAVDFTRGECTFCGDCVRACPEDAFDREAFDAGAAPWTLVAAIGEKCLARSQVVCQTCGDACAPRAIRFHPVLGGVPVPQLDATACTGCGACVAVCPASAITIAAAPIPAPSVGSLQ